MSQLEQPAISDGVVIQRLTAALFDDAHISKDDQRINIILRSKSDAECRRLLEAYAAEKRLDIGTIIHTKIDGFGKEPRWNGGISITE